MTKVCPSLMIAVLLICAPAGAADEISAETQRELASQLDALRREKRVVSTELEKKPEIEVEKEEKVRPAEDEEGPFFYLQKIRLTGNVVIPSSDFKEAQTAFENRKTSFAHLRSFSEIVTNRYRAEGYLTSRAYLPPQTIEDGQVEVRVLEGKVGKIFVEGNQYFSKKSYEQYMRFDRGRIFRYQDLEQSLYYLNRRPDRSAKAFLIAGEALGESDLILKVKDKNPFHAAYTFSNRGTKLTHRARHGLNLTHNNFLGFDDVLNANLTLAEQGSFDGGSFYYDVPFENIPAHWTLSGGYVKTILIKHLSSAEIKGESFSLSPGFEYDLIRRPEKTVSLALGVDFVNSISRINDVQTSADRVRTLHLGPRVAVQDMGGRSIFNSDIHVGIPGFLGGLKENDRNASIVNTGGDYLFYTASAARYQKLPASMFLLMRVNGQWTRDSLPSPEQFRAGGSSSVRGYPESDAGGDYGWGGGAEINFPVPGLPKKWLIPYTKKTWQEAFRLTGFVDVAKTYLREKSSESSVKDKFLLGAGFGLRFAMEDTLSANADLGWPLGDDSNDENNGQLHLSMRGGF